MAPATTGRILGYFLNDLLPPCNSARHEFGRLFARCWRLDVEKKYRQTLASTRFVILRVSSSGEV